jgi:hypothetical protein
LCRGRFECTEDRDCDDQNPCTIDRCLNTHCYHECSIGQGCQGDWPLPVQGYCVASDGNCACVAPWVVCDDPFDCLPSQFCYKDEKMCGSLGVCKDRPSTCPLIYKPVCGCDGKTYGNSCEAYQAGTSVWYQGECTLTHCFANSMCPQDQYCSFVPCGIETGVCIPRSEICLPEDDPVCGCDNKTYQNACEAGRAGVSINYSGACKECIFDTDCNDGNPCTRDYCYQFKCEYSCQTGEVCLTPGLPGAGMCVLDASGCRCEVTPECTTNLDCNDSNQCTTDLCIDGKCQYKCNVGSRCSIELPIPVEGTCQEQLGSCVCSPSAKPCNSNLDCSKSEYCQFQTGTCAPPGTCVLRPLMCPDVFDPVCGCDGITYNNACEAAQAGVSIKHDGECEGVPQCRRDADCDDFNQCTTDLCIDGMCQYKCNVGSRCSIELPIPVEGTCQEQLGSCVCSPLAKPCNSNLDCSKSEYCQFQTGTCAPPGTCVLRPLMCPDVFDPVCGCDGITYNNACEAAQAGVSIKHEGECDGVPQCRSDADCNDSNQCTTDTCVAGVCEYKCNVGEGCTVQGPIPVEGKCQEEFGACGCLPEGVQACASNADCTQNQYCQFQPGTCAPPGACTQKPSMCPFVYNPVCGCDGRTYDNACLAARAGVSIRYLGACEIGPM